MNANEPLGAQNQRACLRALLAKQVIPLILLAVFAWIIFDKATDLNFASIKASVNAITAQQWSLAILGSAISFWAVGRMDVVVHRLLDTGVNDSAAQLSGIASVATAQLTGFGLLIGTLARWRVLSGIGLWKAAQITAFVSISFMIALGVLTAVMIFVASPDLPWIRPFAALGLALITILITASIWKPRWLFRFNLPPLKAQAALLALALLDTIAAALALYVLFPGADIPPPALFYTVFLMSLALGLLGTTPGGVGPFEMMMLACFSHLPSVDILAAIMGYRLVYFALPAMLAVVVLLGAPWLNLAAARSHRPRVQTHGARPVPAAALTYTAARAETGLMHQGELDLLVDHANQAVSLVTPTGQSLIMLADPLTQRQCAGQTLKVLHTAANDRFLSPCLYKCNARTAVTARRAGWSLLQVAQEAVIDPQTFETSARNCRQLRRAMRKAEAHDVTVTEAANLSEMTALRAIAESWGQTRKGTRGFSMGRFDESYISAQRIYLAHKAGRLIGFVTFHENWRERTLDLMCYNADAPSGTAHMLVHAAIQGAKTDNISRVSLAAVPSLSQHLPLPDALKSRAATWTGAAGLKQFKSSFAPRWEPLYIAAPNRLSLTLSGIDITDRITRPRRTIKRNS